MSHNTDFIPNIQFIFIIVIAVIFALMIPKTIDTITNISSTDDMCNNIPMQIVGKDKKVRANEEYVRCNSDRVKKLEGYAYKKFIAVTFIFIITLATSVHIYSTTGEFYSSLLGVMLGSLLGLVINLCQNWNSVSNNTKTIVTVMIFGAVFCSYSYLCNEVIPDLPNIRLFRTILRR